MSAERLSEFPSAMRRALIELEEIIRRSYPTAHFGVARPEHEGDAIDLVATVDVEDPDEVMDLVIDRVLALQLEDGLQVHVVPVRALEREAPQTRLRI